MKTSVCLSLIFLFQTVAQAKVEELIRVDPEQSSVTFTAIGNPSMLTIEGKGNQLKGDLTLQDKEIKGNITFDLNRLDTGISLRDEHMKTHYLETEKEQKKMALTEISLMGANALKIPLTVPAGGNFSLQKIPFTGMLKLHGQERMVKGLADVERKDKKLKAVATFTVPLNDFGITIPNYAGITVGNEVSIMAEVNGTFEPASPSPSKGQ